MGSTEQNTTGSSQTKTDPWKPTIDPLKGLIGDINKQIPGYKTTANENSAFDQLTANAQAGNPYTGNIDSLAKSLFSGGNGALQQGFDQYKSQMDPYANGSMIGNNTALQSQLNTNANDISSRVNGMFAAAGRDFSGANLNSLSRGITEGNAPIIANQYNQDVQNQMNASRGIYDANNTTANGIASMGQAGVGAANAALQARDSGANQLLNIESQRRNLPLQNLGALTGLLTPLAQLGGKSSTDSSQQTTTTPPLAMQAIQGMTALNGGGGGGWGGSSAGSGANTGTSMLSALGAKG